MGDKVKRQRAYQFIRRTIESKLGRIPKGKDEIAILHDTLGGILELGDTLMGLKEGTHDPTKKLVEAFRNSVGPTVPEFQIQEYLVKPFSSDS